MAIIKGRVQAINSYTGRSLSNNMKNRLMTVVSSHMSVRNSDSDFHRVVYKNFLENIKILSPKNWPLNGNNEVEIQYGGDRVKVIISALSSVVFGFLNWLKEKEDSLKI